MSGVDLENRLSASNIGQVDDDLAVKAPRTQEGRVQHVRAVGSRNDDDSLLGFKAIHLHQKRIERLFPFIVAATQADTAAAAVGATSVKAANADMLADLGDVLDSDGNVAGSVVLLLGVTTFPGMYADGVVSDTVTIRST